MVVTMSGLCTTVVQCSVRTLWNLWS